MFSNVWDLGVPKAYRFRGNNIEEYGIVNYGPVESLTSFTVSFWVNIGDNSAGAILSYAYGKSISNGLLVEMSSGLTFYYTLAPNIDYVKRRY